MGETPDLGDAPERIVVEAEQVRRLVAEQFPHWAGLAVEPVARGGWDNWTFHLGTTMSVRLPSAAAYALAVEKEHRWLPVLAPRLPFPVPTPVARGRPGAGYPFPWSVYAWLAGEPVTSAGRGDPSRLAADLAGFLVALQAVPAAGGPRPGTHNWFRGGPLRTFDDTVRDALDRLADHVDGERVRQVWAQASDARWDGVDRWFHGDLAAGNLLLADGNLAAVIDFGTCGTGDPACDLAVAWTVLTRQGRQEFRERLGVDDATWARGRGWALWKTLATVAGSWNDTDDTARDARRVLAEVLSPAGG